MMNSSASWNSALNAQKVAMLLSCYLLVSEIPMFALKFKTWGWRGNEIKYVFILTCIPLLLILGVTGIAAIIAWYILLSVVQNYTKKS